MSEALVAVLVLVAWADGVALGWLWTHPWPRLRVHSRLGRRAWAAHDRSGRLLP